MSKKDILSLGTEIEVELDQVQDRISGELAKKLSRNSSGIISDYKLTDGQEIGFIIKLIDGTKIWLFQNEVKLINRSSARVVKTILNNKEEKKKGNYSQSNLNISPSRDFQYNAKREKKIAYIMNPVNFSKWLIYSLKDVF